MTNQNKQAFFKAQFEKELAENPDLRALDDPSAASSSSAAASVKDPSVGPLSTAAETPQPTPNGPPTRIKLVSSSHSNVNGGQANGGAFGRGGGGGGGADGGLSDEE